MPRARRLVCLTVLIGLAAGADARAGVGENWQRLRSMPLEQRVSLARKLDEFDALPRGEQEAIRKLDAEIASHSPEVQANYRAVLRRYYLWLQGLPEARRKQVDEAPPEERMRLVNQLRAEARAQGTRRELPLYVHMAELSGPPPFDVAHVIKIWFALGAAERAEVERLPLGSERVKRVRELGRQHQIAPGPRPTKAESDALFRRMEEDPLLKNWTAYTSKKVADPTKNARVRQRLVENYYFIVHPPERVDPDNLFRFESALPSWLRTPFDHLPPEEARRRLTILYRLVYPPPAEIPEANPATVEGPSPPAQRPSPAPKPPEPAPKPSPVF